MGYDRTAHKRPINVSLNEDLVRQARLFTHVLKNPGRRRDAIPFVVVLQNSRFDRGTTRFVTPLILASLTKVAEHYLAPRFTIGGIKVVMDVFNLATLPVDRLGSPVASLGDEESRAKLIRALDELVSQA